MTENFHVIIPARYASSRFPGKLMQDIHGMTVLQRVYGQVLKSGATSITIATDHALMAEHARSFGAQVIMTDPAHKTGTDRIAEVIQKQGFSQDAIIVNVQGDEPFIPPALIKQVASNLANNSAPMATLCWPLESLEQFQNPHVVKVVRSRTHKALYFSRSPIPLNRDAPSNFQHAYKHIGLYAYRAAFLLEYVALPVCELEMCESLEQLRVLWAGYDVQIEVACEKPVQDINTPEDLESILNNNIV